MFIFSAQLLPFLGITHLKFLRFLRKFSVPLPASSVLLLRLLGVEVVFLPLQSGVPGMPGFGVTGWESSVSSPPLCRRSWGLVVASLRCGSKILSLLLLWPIANCQLLLHFNEVPQASRGQPRRAVSQRKRLDDCVPVHR